MCVFIAGDREEPGTRDGGGGHQFVCDVSPCAFVASLSTGDSGEFMFELNENRFDFKAN